ncbi:Hypothetical protein DHA2_150286 [Giardia duodenalis]|uniref:Nucleoporin NSP1-like C-terminal domain-containing protein n=1 Tax=Giardia intestinalis TaxID=5741 RepID=V6TLP7_GIAIN|nr:Hypothetical protein DHA2_150286 [Giardia intestinalis]
MPVAKPLIKTIKLWMSGGFSFGAPVQASSQPQGKAPGFSFGSGFGPAQSTQLTQQPQQSQPAPSFTFGASSTSAPTSANTGTTGFGFSFAAKPQVSGAGGIGQTTSSVAPTTTAPTTASAPAPFSFGAPAAQSSQPAQPTPQPPPSTAPATTAPFAFGKSSEPVTVNKAKEDQPSIASGTQPVTDARLVELEGKKVSAILDNLYSVLLKDLGTANKHSAALITCEKNIELLEETMKQFSSKLTYIQQKQSATEESLRKLYELQCDVLDIVKKMEDYSQYTAHPLTHAINTVESNLLTLEQKILSSSVIDREVLEVYQGLQRQISLIAMLEAEAQ